MVQKPWFKVFVWFMATFFFFLATAVIISILKPGPSESEVMQYMAGMMSAMDSSIMGVMMSIESNTTLKDILVLSFRAFPFIIILSIVLGVILRVVNSEVKNVR